MTKRKRIQHLAMVTLLAGFILPVRLLAQSPDPVLPVGLMEAVSQFGSPYVSRLADLDGDQDLDALVIHYGNQFRGTGGYTLTVYRNSNASFELIGRIPTADVPIYQRQEKTSGMYDLIIYRRGLTRVDGKQGYGRRETIRFNGSSYVPDGTEPNDTTEILQSDQLLMDSLEQP